MAIKLHVELPESVVLKVSTAGELLPYSFMACTDQLYRVLCWRSVRSKDMAVMLREMEVLVTKIA